MKDNVLDGVDILILVGLRATGMGRRDHARVRGELFMKRQKVFLNRVHVGEPVQVKQRRALAVFQNPDFASVHFNGLPAQWTASADCSKFMPGYSSLNCLSEA